MKITKRVVDAAEATEKDYFLWDDELPGFGLRVRPGGSRVYVAQYRNEYGRTRRVTLGKHGVLTPDEARAQARLMLAEVASGGDPAETKLGRRQQPTLTEIADRYMTEHAETKKKPKSIKEDRRLLNKVILPVLGSRKIGEIRRSHIGDLHHSLREHPYQANRALALLSKLFNLCEKWGLREDGTNPTRHVERFKEQSKERFLTIDELSRLGGVLSDAETDGTPSQAIAAIRLLLLTGARLDEILSLRWEYVDLDQRELLLPDSKTGKKRIQLGTPAVELLENLPHKPWNPYVIAGKKQGQHFIGLPKIWSKLRKKAGLEDVRLHDMRHNFASEGEKSGLSIPIIAKLLGHRELRTTEKYIHTTQDPVKQAADKVAEKINGALNTRRAVNDKPSVVPIHRSK
jgi:integrase